MRPYNEQIQRGNMEISYLLHSENPCCIFVKTTYENAAMEITMKPIDILRKLIFASGVVFIILVFYDLFFIKMKASELEAVTWHLAFWAAGVLLLVFVELLKPKSLYVCIFIVIITFACGLIFKFSNPELIGDGDMQFYYGNAVKLYEEGFKFPALYVAIFPGTVTYPAVLAALMKIFGVSRMVPAVLNYAALSAVSCSVYLFFRKRMPEVWAAAGALLIVLNPMMIIYSTVCNAEIPFSALIILSFFAFAKAVETEKKGQYKWLVISALLCGASQIFRPLTIIMIIALVMWILIFQNFDMKTKIIHVALICLVFMVFSAANSKMVESITGYEPPKSSYGWNLYIGASETGQWNQRDSDLFTERLEIAETPTELQSFFADAAWQRYGDIGTGIIKHGLDKLRPWLPYGYVASQVYRYEGSAPSAPAEELRAYEKAIMMYDLPILALALFGCILAMIKGMSKNSKKYDIILIMVFYIVGSFFVLMLTEIAPRYTVGYRPIFCLLAVYSVREIYVMIKSLVSARATV